MQLRKVKDNIYLGIFNFEFMQWLDNFIYKTVLNSEDHPFLSNLFSYPDENVFDFYYIRVDSTGEAYLNLEICELKREVSAQKNEKFFRYELTPDILKNMFKLQLDILKSFTILDKNDTNLTSYEMNSRLLSNNAKIDMKTNIKNIQMMLRLWEGTATDKDLKNLGKPLNPFELAEHDFINAWKCYNKLLIEGDDAEFKMAVPDIRKIFEKTLK